MAFKHYLEHIYMEDKGYLSSQFTIGFELEGWMPRATNKTAEDFWQFAVDFFTERGYSMVSKNIDWDASVHPDDGSHEQFELQSPVFPCTPHAIQDIIHFLDQARRFGIETNNTCGLHVHIGFPDKMSVMEDRLWTILQILFSKDNILDKFASFRQFMFTSNTWAHTRYLAFIKNQFETMGTKVLQGGDLSETFSQFYTEVYKNSTKESILNLHQQGTLEWRGPRAFLDSGEYKYVKDFFIELPKLINTLSNLLNEQKITVTTKHGDFTLRKSDYTIMMPKEGRHAPRVVRKRFIDKDSRFNWREQNSTVLEQAFKDLLWLKKADLSGVTITQLNKEQYKYSIKGSILKNARNVSDCELSGFGTIENCTIGDQNTETDIIDSSVFHSDIFNTDSKKSEFSQGAYHDGYISNCILKNMKMVRPTCSNSDLNNCNVTGGSYTKTNFTNSTITGGKFNNCSFHSCKRLAGTFDESCHIQNDVHEETEQK